MGEGRIGRVRRGGDKLAASDGATNVSISSFVEFLA
jgi:hypothetical protein